MPPYIPLYLAMVRLNGFFEIRGGLACSRRGTRRLAPPLIAVFPANVYMATNPIEAGGRLPLQALFFWWVLWCTRPRLVFR
jgi:uncharacterized membrane protein